MARLDGLEIHFRANAQALCRESGGRVTILSAVRTYAEQVVLYKRYLSGGGPIAAKPGTSKHEVGLAIDFDGDMGLLARLAPSFLMVRTVPSESWHYEPLWSRNPRETPRYASGVTGNDNPTHVEEPDMRARLCRDKTTGAIYSVTAQGKTHLTSDLVVKSVQYLAPYWLIANDPTIYDTDPAFLNALPTLGKQ